MASETEKAEQFTELRPLLFSIAYRILGSVSEAEDAVQESWLRYETAEAQILHPRAFLSSVVTRISIDVLRSARVRREQYVGEWFPEPLLTDPYDDPEHAVALSDTISISALLLLERLSPLERAVFVLRDVFVFSFAEIGEIVERSASACRQLAVRARRHMAQGRPRFEADRRKQEQLAEKFFSAFIDGDVDGLKELLVADVELSGDSGGRGPSLPQTVVGADQTARLLTSVSPHFTGAGLHLEPHEVNGEPGALARDAEDRIVSVMSLEIHEGGIQRIRTMNNPDKLRHLGPVGDVWKTRDVIQGMRSEDPED